MKIIILSVLITFVCQKSFSQTNHPVDSATNKTSTSTDTDEDDRMVFTKAEKSPEFPGGEASWTEYLQKNLNSNTPALNGAPAGTYQVVIRFVVKKDGSLENFAAETGYGFGMEVEVIRILKASPKWKCAEQNGYHVNFMMRQPVTFVVAVK